ncbi:Uncharacterised protein [Cedecea neteri]|uniref:Uncharacterized protein n=1 Tax=Cedecea neteri TaxID=158822 RepID=A0A2X3INL4_9ENTR|nr:Uncharacterised protein [Cedecea neteri]
MADIAQHVAHWVNFYLVEADFLHLFFYAVNDAFFVAAFARDGNHIAQETSHVLLVVVCFFKNQFKRNMLSHAYVLQF